MTPNYLIVREAGKVRVPQEPEEVWVGLGQQGRVEQCPGQVQLVLRFCPFFMVYAVFVYVVFLLFISL